MNVLKRIPFPSFFPFFLFILNHERAIQRLIDNPICSPFGLIQRSLLTCLHFKRFSLLYNYTVLSCLFLFPPFFFSSASWKRQTIQNEAAHRWKLLTGHFNLFPLFPLFLPPSLSSFFWIVERLFSYSILSDFHRVNNVGTIKDLLGKDVRLGRTRLPLCQLERYRMGSLTARRCGVHSRETSKLLSSRSNK